VKSYLGQSNLPRGIRNNNPGNLILTNIAWQGKVPNAQNTDGHFEQFTFIEYGIRAMAMDIIGDINKGKNTLTLLIEEYAPRSENDTTAYINSVSSRTGIAANDIIPMTTGVVASIIRAKLAVENGAVVFNYISDADIEAGLALVPEKFLQKKTLLESVKDNWAIYTVVVMVLMITIWWFLNQ